MSDGIWGKTLSGVLAFSLLGGVTTGLLAAVGFMPDYAMERCWKLWHPGSTQVSVLEEMEAKGHPGSRVLHVDSWDVMGDLGLDSSRLWRYCRETAAATPVAVVGHGLWRRSRLAPGDHLDLKLGEEMLQVPVAGIWYPYHPQLGDNWLVLVGYEASNTTVLSLIPPANPRDFPPAYPPGRLLMFMLLSSLVFSLYGILGFVERRGSFQILGWLCKLWCGGLAAVATAVVVAVTVYQRAVPLPIDGIVPGTAAIIAGSYLLVLLPLTAISLVWLRLKAKRRS